MVGAGIEVDAFAGAELSACWTGAGAVGAGTVGAGFSAGPTVHLAGFEIEATSCAAGLVGLASADTVGAGAVGAGSSTSTAVVKVCFEVDTFTIANILACGAGTPSADASVRAHVVTCSTMCLVGVDVHTDVVAQLPSTGAQASTTVAGATAFADVPTGSAVLAVGLQSDTLSIALGFIGWTECATSSFTNLSMGTGLPTGSAVSVAGL